MKSIKKEDGYDRFMYEVERHMRDIKERTRKEREAEEEERRKKSDTPEARLRSAQFAESLKQAKYQWEREFHDCSRARLERERQKEQDAIDEEYKKDNVYFGIW